jgi:two-component system sensor histidine kinase UhpB
MLLAGLASFTGGVLLTPFVYLIFEFLRQQHRHHLLGLDTIAPPRTSLIIWCSLFYYRDRHADGAVTAD